MAAANQTVDQQSIVQDVIVPPTSPITPDNAPAGPTDEQPSANVLHGAQTDPPGNMADNVHPLLVQDTGPAAVVAPNVHAVLGASPLLRSLYGRQFGD